MQYCLFIFKNKDSFTFLVQQHSLMMFGDDRSLLYLNIFKAENSSFTFNCVYLFVNIKFIHCILEQQISCQMFYKTAIISATSYQVLRARGIFCLAMFYVIVNRRFVSRRIRQKKMLCSNSCHYGYSGLYFSQMIIWNKCKKGEINITNSMKRIILIFPA